MSDPTYYVHTDQLDYYLSSFAWIFEDSSEVIELPHKTKEKRRVLAVRLGKKAAKKVSTILITGNVHARELGGADFCLYLANDLCRAYEAGTGLVYGDKSFSRDQVRFIMEELNLIIVPCVNPDGRYWVETGVWQGKHAQALWRGNRNYSGACYGVDLNRNQDFLWDHELHFSPYAQVMTTSDPCDPDQLYRGRSPTSEPETQNIVWLLDQYPTINAYLDIHCHYGAIVYPWGDDENQSHTPSMNFKNAAYDGVRDPQSGDYREYIPEGDVSTFRDLGDAFRDGLKAVRGNHYQRMQSVKLTTAGDSHGPTYKPTSGANDDYAYSRHFSKRSRMKVFAFTVEFGEQASDGGDFQPPFPEMARIIEELCAGTLAFCLRAHDVLPAAPALLGCLKNFAAVAAVIAGLLALLRQCG